jgi:hypothetical protein
MSSPAFRGAPRALRSFSRLHVISRRAKSSAAIDGQQQLLSANLQEADPAVFDIIEKEKNRQKHFINLIPSENFTSQAVLDALGSVMQSMLYKSKYHTDTARTNFTRQINTRRGTPAHDTTEATNSSTNPNAYARREPSKRLAWTRMNGVSMFSPCPVHPPTSTSTPLS